MTAADLEQAKYIQEWFKVAASIATPLVIAVLTYFVSRALNDRQSDLRAGEQIVAMKQASYAVMGPQLNRIFVYIADVGDYRDYAPSDIIRLKREVDRQFHAYKPFWSLATRSAYDAFMDGAFETDYALATNARIRTPGDEKRAAAAKDGKPWTAEMAACLTGDRHPNIRDLYDRLVEEFIRDISVRTLQPVS